MKNIEIITIQQKFVFDTILSKGVYHADTEKYVVSERSNLLEPYKYLMNSYGYKHFPIFACPIGCYCEFGGARTDGEAVMLQLSVPEDEIKVQKYYNWSDLIFFMENPGEWSNEQYPLPSFYHDVLFSESLHSVGRSACQITIEKIKREWLVDSKPLTDSFCNTHVFSGGSEVLKGINNYE